MTTFSDYPLMDRCRWWCDMNAHQSHSDFPFRMPDDGYGVEEMFVRLSKATPVKDRLALWNERYSGKNRHKK